MLPFHFGFSSLILPIGITYKDHTPYKLYLSGVGISNGLILKEIRICLRMGKTRPEEIGRVIKCSRTIV